MVKNSVLWITLLFSVVVAAQEATSSPYSFYGIGELKFKGAFENRAMGGVAVFKDSIHLNFQNPASYSYLTRSTYAIGGSYVNTNLTTADERERAQRSTLDYMAVGLPLGKSSVAFGVMPYTAVGYKIRNTFTDSEELERNKRFSGKGGVNRVFLGYGHQISPNLSLGADISYNFGSISTSSLEYITGVQYGTRELNETNVTGFSFNAGLMYNRKINEKYSLSGSLTYSPESKLTLDNSNTISIVTFVDPDNPTNVDTEETTIGTKSIKAPSKFTFGIGFGDVKRFGIGTQLTLIQSNSFGNRFDDITHVTFENGSKIGIGGYFIPKYNSFSNYWYRTTYRAGFAYEKTGMVINNEEIKDYGITFGLGLPVGGSISNINVGFEIGSRGTTKANLVRENYVNLLISLSLNDKWFVKKKYN